MIPVKSCSNAKSIPLRVAAFPLQTVKSNARIFHYLEIHFVCFKSLE